MDDPGHEVRTSWRTWSLASVLHTHFIFEDQGGAVRNHFPGVSFLWWCHFIQHQPRMWTWSHSLCSLRISTALPVQRGKELLTESAMFGKCSSKFALGDLWCQTHSFDLWGQELGKASGGLTQDHRWARSQQRTGAVFRALAPRQLLKIFGYNVFKNKNLGIVRLQ